MQAPRVAAQPPANFDRIARIYCWAEYLSLGPLLQQTRTALLDEVSGCCRAVLLGDGDGRFVARLLTRHAAMQAMAVDSSAAMLRLLVRRSERARVSARLCTVQGSAQDFALPASTDLLVTHFFLDCLAQPEVECLVGRVAAAVQPGALWLLSDFAIPRSALLQAPARLYIRMLYFAFRLLTGLTVQELPDPQTALVRHGFRRIARKQKLLGLLYAELWVLETPQNSRGTTPLPRDSSTPL